MSGEKEQKYLEGEVVNAISRSFLVETDSAEYPHIDLVRNFVTTAMNPLLEEIGLFSKLKLEVIDREDGVPGKLFKIIELTQASAREKFEKCYALALSAGHVSIPEGLSDLTPPPIKLDEYIQAQAAKENSEKLSMLPSSVITATPLNENNHLHSSNQPANGNGHPAIPTRNVVPHTNGKSIEIQ